MLKKKYARIYPPVEIRFNNQVTKTKTCWIWKGAIGSKGRGYICVKPGKRQQVHRFSYEYYIGKIPTGLLVCHHCDNPLCVRPSHLFVGTDQDNKNDMVAKGRSTKGRMAGEKHPFAQLTDFEALEIKRLFASGDYSQKELKNKFSVSYSVIHGIVREKRWKHLTSIND